VATGAFPDNPNPEKIEKNGFCVNYFQQSTGKTKEELLKELDELTMKSNKDFATKLVSSHGEKK
jgi:predicted nuclease of restriction endonuclease-like RecB superfamily